MTPHIRCAVRGALLLTAVLAGAPAAADVVTVGHDAQACHHTDLQAAIDDLAARPSGAHTVRIAADGAYTGTSLTVAADDLTIAGGFASCASQTPTSTRSLLLGGTGSVLTALPGPSGSGRLRLVGLTLEDGDAERGGGIRASGPVDVVLENVLVKANRAEQGGGVHVSAGASLTLGHAVGVNGNQTVLGGLAPHGGGIACTSGATVRAFPVSAVLLNETAASGRGGGIALADCTLVLEGNVRIGSNEADAGAGIWGDAGSQLLLRGTRTGAVLVTLNRAGEALAPGMGGGILLTGAGTSLLAENARIEENRALPEDGSGFGGGIVLLDGARATLRRTLAGDCHDPDDCATLSGNRAGRSAAAAVTSGSRLELLDTQVHLNVADSSVLSVNSGGTRSELVMEGATLAANGGATLVAVEGKSRFRFAFSTASGNFGLQRMVRVSSSQAQAPAVVEAVGAILFETAPAVQVLDVSTPATLVTDCLVVHDDAGLPEGTRLLVEDPQLLNPEGGDLHLALASPAVDFCPPIAGAPRLDMELDVRGHATQPGVTDATPFDAGADEIGPPGVVFQDGFDDGLARWSAVVGAGPS